LTARCKVDNGRFGCWDEGEEDKSN
jgi:hypothetical protein